MIYRKLYPTVSVLDSSCKVRVNFGKGVDRDAKEFLFKPIVESKH